MRRSPLHLLHRPEQAANRLFENGAIRSMTPRQQAVLVAVSENEGCNLVAVAERTGIDRATLGEIVGRLVRKGLLQRRRSRTDTRSKVLRLTDGGRLLLGAAGPVGQSIDELLLAVLPTAQRKPFLAALQAVVRALEERSV